MRPLLCAAALLLAGCHGGQVGRPAPAARWVGTWEAAPQRTEPQNMPPAPGLDGRTLRQVIHVSLGGSALRLGISNAFGDGPLRIAAVRVATAFAGTELATDSIADAPGVTVRFAGAETLFVAAGGTVLSDPVALRVEPLSNVTVSMLVTRAPASLTGHPGSRTTSYIAAGDLVAAPSLALAARTDHWYLLSGVAVANDEASAVVVLGNSIADGRGSGTNRNDRWPDNLARRLQASERTRHVAVLNAGIGGNAVLHGGLGPTALARLDRDVLAQPGVRWLILSEGVNDIGGAQGDEGADRVARELIAGYASIVSRAHQAGVRVYGATILPFGGSFYASPAREAARQRVNAWIRGSGTFDAVVDLDAALRDPGDSSRLRADADGGDHLHPNARGYRMIGDAVDLRLFEQSGARGK